MGVEISEASQDAPYLFQALLYGESLQKKHGHGHTWSHAEVSLNLCPLQVLPQEIVLAGILVV